MDASTFVGRIRAAGFSVECVGDGLAVNPASALNDSQRQFIRDHKPAILRALRLSFVSLIESDGDDVPASNDGDDVGAYQRMMKAAMDLCDAYGDSKQAQAVMVLDLQDVPPEQYRWHEKYFRERIRQVMGENSI